MDGLDGLAGGCMAVSIAALSFSLDALLSLDSRGLSSRLHVLELESS